jgi:outer membrane protein TolC
VALSQRLPWFGKRSSEAAAASAEAEAAKSDFEATRRALMLSALGLYDQYYVAVRSLEINAQHVELLRQLRSSAALQFESGRGSAQDPLQAEAELAHTEHESAVLSAQRDVTVAQMNELLHRPPEHPLPPPPKELALLKEPQGLDVKRLESQAVTGRPEIAAARQRARAEQARADRAGREYFPDFTVSTSYNSMWDMPEHRWMVGLGFNLPLQSGRRGGTADEAEAMRAQFENDARRMEDAARTQVFILMRQLDESKHVLSLFEERLLPVARNQVDAARASFISSRSPFSAVIEAEKNLRSAERDYQMARAECDRRRAELGIALGRFASLDCKGGER